MSWVTVIWSMTASACLTLALVHGFIWFSNRSAWANLLFALAAVGTAALAWFELAMMRADTPAAFGSALRWGHLAVWMIFLSLVAFVRLHLHAGRPWLAWSACGVRTLSLILKFLTGQTLNYREITSLRHIPFFGESVAVAEGIPNPWMLIGNLSLLLLVIFVADAALCVWRRGDRRQALAVGGSIVCFVLAATGQAVLVLWGIVQWPVTASLFFTGIAAAMGYELSRDVLRAAQLSHDLNESEQRMTLATEAANLGIWHRELTRDEFWASAQWRALFGYTKSERLSLEYFLERLHPDDRETTRQALAKATAGEGGYEAEYRVMLPDGQMRWIASRGSVEFNGRGQAVRLRGVSVDISRRKQAELETLAQRDQITHLLRVATLGELSGALAHELNQPLAAILSNAQAAQRFLAQASSDPEEIREILKDIMADDQRASDVIRQLRTLLKKGEFLPQPLDVNELLQEVRKLMNFELTARWVSVVTQFTGGLPPVRGDQVQLQQVLINLMLNASEAMTQMPVGARAISLRSNQGTNGTVQISVADTGSGIPAGNEEKIFEAYHTTKPQGLGLGLSLSRSIIVAHGGRMWAENQANGGAVFHFTLPEWTGNPP
jgi:PAS domain S-box-containing protein